MKKQLWADGALFAVVVSWGYAFAVIKNALNEIEPFNFLMFRFVIAFVILVIIFYKRIFAARRETYIAGFIVGIFLFLAYILQTLGLKYTTASNAGFITGFSVVLVPVFSSAILKSIPSGESIIGVILAVAGLFLLSYNDTVPFNRGDILVVFCAVFVAFHILSVGYYTKRTDSIVLAVIQVGVVALFSIAGAFVFEKPEIPTSSIVWKAIIITALFATVGAYLVQNIMQRFTSATRTALIFTGEPVFAGIFGYLLLGETLGRMAGLGCVLILSGMIISELKLFKQKPGREIV
ncbi:MAG: DMT family transporter [Spirochaetota bacterium]